LEEFWILIDCLEMFRVLNPNSALAKFCAHFGKKRAIKQKNIHTHATPGRLAQTHPRDGDDFNRLRSQSHPRRHQRKRRIAFGGRVWYLVAEFVDTGKKEVPGIWVQYLIRALVDAKPRAFFIFVFFFFVSRLSDPFLFFRA